MLCDRYTNKRFMAQYGFVVEGNSADRLELQLSPTQGCGPLSATLMGAINTAHAFSTCIKSAKWERPKTVCVLLPASELTSFFLWKVQPAQLLD